jgi:acyl-ACP thioesterase
MRGKTVFKVRSYECGADSRATLPTICNYLQEAASVNAEYLGFSKSDFDSAGENISWVLTRLVVKMDRYPMWEDEVTVETFPRGGRRIVAWRDFELKDSDSKRLGVASSEWMLIDLATRKVVKIPEAVFDAADPADTPLLGEMPFTKFKFPDVAGTPACSFRAQKSHIDMNGHVNSIKYIEHIMDLFPMDCYADASNLHRLEIAYMAESRFGDLLSFFRRKVSDTTYEVEVRKDFIPGGDRGTPVVRALLNF